MPSKTKTARGAKAKSPSKLDPRFAGAIRERKYDWVDPKLTLQGREGLAGMERLQAQLAGALPASPMSRTVGWTLHAIEPGKAQMMLVPDEHMMNTSTVHGGALASVLDSAMSHAANSTLPSDMLCQTVELKVTFIRAVTIATGAVIAEAHVLQGGSRFAFTEAKILDKAGKIYAHATATFFIQPRKKTS